MKRIFSSIAKFGLQLRLHQELRAEGTLFPFTGWALMPLQPWKRLSLGLLHNRLLSGSTG